MSETFIPNGFYGKRDQIGDGKLFGCHKSRQKAVDAGLLDPGYLVNGLIKNTGEQLNQYLDRIAGLKKPLPKGFGGAQPGAGRPRKNPQTSVSA
jgi:hypothetical protein